MTDFEPGRVQIWFCLGRVEIRAACTLNGEVSHELESQLQQ